MFSRARSHERGIAYIYAAVRDPKSGAWAAISPEHRGMQFYAENWDELLSQIQGKADTKWIIWHGELEELAASPEPAATSEPGEAPTCEHGHARYSMSMSSGLGGAH